MIRITPRFAFED
ncbi:hypothetical protein D027_4501A, partial [Vibrio parahaemolyticus 861]